MAILVLLAYILSELSPFIKVHTDRHTGRQTADGKTIRLMILFKNICTWEPSLLLPIKYFCTKLFNQYLTFFKTLKVKKFLSEINKLICNFFAFSVFELIQNI